MSTHEKEFFATSEAEALEKAAAFYGVEASKLQIRRLDTVVEGMGDRACFVVGDPNAAEPAPRGPRPERSERPRDRDRDRDRGPRDRDRGRRERDRGPGRDRRPRGDKPEGVDHEKFEALAREAAARVLDTGEDVLLEPMGSKERWVVHNCIKEIAGVTSASEGDGDDRQIRVFEG